jgi:predicted pyridoxine 5'-phosphate oxidase superfamily flavin-nucleotide-binding protein
MNSSWRLLTVDDPSGRRLLQHTSGTRPRAERFYARQVLDHLNQPMRDFVTRQRLMYVATTNGRGACACDIRTGPTGFVRVLDRSRLAWLEGSDVLHNIGRHPRVGLLFMDFGRDSIGLHVNGLAEVVEDADLRAAHPALPAPPVPRYDRMPWVLTYVEEAYVHCGKFIPRLEEAPPDDSRQ